MNNLGSVENLQYLYMDLLPYILKIFFISICTYYTFIKITNTKTESVFKFIIVFLITFIISILSGILKYNSITIIGTLCLMFLLSILYSIITNTKIGYCILITVISISINHIVFFIALTINFLPNIIFHLPNDYIKLFFISCIHILLLYFVFKIKKFKNGFIFLKDNSKNDFFEILILNISTALIFLSITFNIVNYCLNLKLIVTFILVSIIMFITIKKSFEIYYKQNLLIKELQETKETLKQKEEEISKLEKENLAFSKTSHSIAHKQKSLEFKLNELLLKSETASELDIRDRINEISNAYLSKCPAVTELAKTDIVELDDMLKFIQSECIKNNIDFELQINGNIHHMVNNFIDKENLEILLADLIKNSIIAINHSDNVNRSILVKLGIVDEFYSLFVYDSGIEFEINTLLSLGDKPCSTHLDTGGTGMGFMNTFDTLRKYNASIIINELNPPSKDNYTKVIIIKFDRQNIFKVSSYRSEEIKKQSTTTNFIID